MPGALTNMTNFTEFLLMGLPDGHVLQTLYATVFLVIFLAALIGNFLIITLTTIGQHLQSPMYFFVKNLSLIDIRCISVIVPKSIVNSFTNICSISFLGCVFQVFCVIFLAGSEFGLLLVMFYDRYAAVCHPLHCETSMNRVSCAQMVATAWLSGYIYGFLHAAGTFSVRLCGSNILFFFIFIFIFFLNFIIIYYLLFIGSNILHQFCDIPSLLTLACSGEQILEYTFIIISCCFAFICFILMVVSYVHIFTIILRIPSRGKFKTFSTYIPHFTAVTLFLSSGSGAYLGSKSKSPSSLNIFMSVFYSLLPPSLNPVIYSLRNRDMKVALCNILGGKIATSLCLENINYSDSYKNIKLFD